MNSDVERKTLPTSVYIIAEAGVNHNGSAEIAGRMIEVAKDSGADAIKFQSFKAEQIVTAQAAKAEYQEKNTSSEETQFQMLRRLELADAAQIELFSICKKSGIDFLSTPFDLLSLRFLAKDLGIPTIKLASGDVTNAPLLLQTARYGCRVILSTGMCTLAEVEFALSVLAHGYTQASSVPTVSLLQESFASDQGRSALQEKVTLLHCTSEYPCQFDEANLRAMDTLRCAFGLRVGFSDHTNGVSVAIAATARGATVIEKHFTLDRNLAGPDHRSSLEPNELKLMVKSIREVEVALGSGHKVPAPSESKNRLAVRRSLVAAKDITIGDVFSEENLVLKRPGAGISGMRYWEWLGRKATRNYEKDEMIES